MSKYKVLVADAIAEAGVEELQADPELEIDVRTEISADELLADAADYHAIIVRSRLVGGRRLYSARVGAGSRGAARRLCARIKRAGGACVVRRN